MTGVKGGDSSNGGIDDKGIKATKNSGVGGDDSKDASIGIVGAARIVRAMAMKT